MFNKIKFKKMKRNRVKMSSIICGLLFISAGVLLFAFNSGILPLEFKSVVFSWQMLLLALGFAFLFQRETWFAGIILMIIGGFFILPKLDIVGLGFVAQNYWAIGCVVLGIIVVCKAIWKQHSCFCKPKGYHKKWEKSYHFHDLGHNKDEGGYIDRNNVFGGSKEKIDFSNFKGGEINTVFGGIELDLSDSKLAEGVHRLEINSVFGGMVLFVPINWNIEMQSTNIFGNFVDNRPKPAFEIDEKRTLIIEANAVFGGGEIKCKE